MNARFCTFFMLAHTLVCGAASDAQAHGYVRKCEVCERVQKMFVCTFFMLAHTLVCSAAPPMTDGGGGRKFNCL